MTTFASRQLGIPDTIVIRIVNLRSWVILRHTV